MPICADCRCLTGTSAIVRVASASDGLRHPLADDDQARGPLGGILQVLARFLDRYVERHRVGRGRLQAVDAVLEHAASIVRQAAADRDDGYAMLLRCGSD